MTADDDGLERAIELARRVRPEDFDRVEPPPELWSAIERAIREAPQESGAPLLHAVPGSPREQTRAAGRRRRMSQLLAVAAAVAALALAVTFVATRPGPVERATATTTTTSPAEVVLATTTLDVLEGTASAEATLVRVGGTERLRVVAHDMAPPPPGTFYELWLVDPGVTDPRSLGAMTGSTEVTVPASIDPTRYPVVDISLQAVGTHQHSGHSLLRGTLS